MRKGSLDTIIAETREKFDLPMEVEINKYTICSHLKPAHKIHVAHQGPLLSMVQEEALLLKMILLLADKQAPVTCREGLELANSLVRGMARLVKSKSGNNGTYLTNNQMRRTIMMMTVCCLDKSTGTISVPDTAISYLQNEHYGLISIMMTGAW